MIYNVEINFKSIARVDPWSCVVPCSLGAAFVGSQGFVGGAFLG